MSPARVARGFALLVLCTAGRAHAQTEPESAADAAPASEPAEELQPLAANDSTAWLARAEQAMTQLDYAQSCDLARVAIARGKLSRDDLARAYRLIGVASAQLGDEASAEAAFIRLFALDSDPSIASRLAPARRSAVLNAQGFWSVRKQGFGLSVSYARRARQVIVRVRDPLAWTRQVHVWLRFGDRPYVELERSAAEELVFDVENIGPTDALEVYAFAVDENGNVLGESGRERHPQLFDLSEQELDEILRRDIRGGQTGSYALRLEELGVQVGMHGYLSLELKPIADVASFDLHHATAMLRASFQHAVSLEIALEWEHLAREQSDFYLPHAFVDVKLAEWLIVRGGFFEVPLGAFNEYLYPDFLRITGLPPQLSRSIVPGLWSEVGLQLRGRFDLGPLTQLTYAAYIVNGLEQSDSDPDDGMLQEGGDIRAMRFNARDENSGNKALGGRLGLEFGEFDLGVSGYTGRYTIEAHRQLSMADIDLSYRSALLTIRSEGAMAWQETSGPLLRKYGLYLLIALRPIAHLEPYAQYDYIEVDGRLQRVLVGCAVYPFPHDRSTRNLRLKSEVGYDFPEERERVFVWFFQLTTGF